MRCNMWPVAMLSRLGWASAALSPSRELCVLSARSINNEYTEKSLHIIIYCVISPHCILFVTRTMTYGPCIFSRNSLRQCLLASFNQVHLVARHRDLSYYLKRRRLILSVWTGVEDSPDSQVAVCQFLSRHLFCSLFLPNSFCG